MAILVGKSYGLENIAETLLFERGGDGASALVDLFAAFSACLFVDLLGGVLVKDCGLTM